MRRDAMNYEAPQVERMSGYHRGGFQRLVVFNSDRKINLDSDYSVSDDNSESTKKIVKVGSHMKVIGLEMETVSPMTRHIGETVLTNIVKLAISKAGFDDDFFKLESDCTVDLEAITQTFTKGWLRNNYKLFKALYDLFSELNVTTDSERCGMHVNLDLAWFGNDSMTQIENVRKLGYLINKNYDLFKVAFNRIGDTGWCPRMNSTKEYWKNNPLNSFPVDHSSCCVNMGHIRQNRVEIRLVGGQRNYACFRNTMETVLQIVPRVCKLSWDELDDLYKVFKGCNRHVFDRLASNCFNAGVIDSALIEKIRPTVTDERFL